MRMRYICLRTFIILPIATEVYFLFVPVYFVMLIDINMRGQSFQLHLGIKF